METWCLVILQLLSLNNNIVLGDPQLLNSFPENFMFGTATSAYQSEGAWDVDGKGPSIWDSFTHEHPEYFRDRSNGDDAAKSYYKYKEDIKAVKNMGMQFYRFTISWPRIMPTGLPNTINQKGIEYYNNLIDEAIKAGIIPMVAMLQWELPLHLQTLGGWTNEIVAIYFEEYATVLYENFGDRVKWWLTFNEQIIAALGYEWPMFAPGGNNSGEDIYLATHNLLKSHARAYHMYNSHYRAKQNGKVAIAQPLFWPEPLNKSSSIDRRGVKMYMNFYTGLHSHPIFSKEGDYNEGIKYKIGNMSLAQGYQRSRLPEFTREEIQYIRGTADFFGVNTYAGCLVTGEDTDNDVGAIPYVPHKWPRSETVKWETIVPVSIRHVINWITEEYGSHWDIFIVENGFADDGKLNDDMRITYLAVYLIEVLKAIYIDHCKVIGYTVWSLIDVFEWQSGYTSKFGLYHVDFNDPERRRTPKKSAYFMRNVTRTREIPKKYFAIGESLNTIQYAQWTIADLTTFADSII